MAGTHALGMSIHTVYPFGTAQLACFHFTPEPTMSIFIRIFFPLNPLTHSQNGHFFNGYVLFTKRKRVPTQ